MSTARCSRAPEQPDAIILGHSEQKTVRGSPEELSMRGTPIGGFEWLGWQDQRSSAVRVWRGEVV